MRSMRPVFDAIAHERCRHSSRTACTRACFSVLNKRRRHVVGTLVAESALCREMIHAHTREQRLRTQGCASSGRVAGAVSDAQRECRSVRVACALTLLLSCDAASPGLCHAACAAQKRWETRAEPRRVWCGWLWYCRMDDASPSRIAGRACVCMVRVSCVGHWSGGNPRVCCGLWRREDVLDWALGRWI